MVLVFHQMLVSALLYLSNKLKAFALNVSGEERKQGIWLTKPAQDALVALCTAKDLLSFTISTETFLHCLLPEASDIITFMLNPDSDELEALAQDVVNVPRLPRKGIARQIIKEKKKIHISSLPSDDPLTLLVPSSVFSDDNNNNQQVTLSPLLNKDDQLLMLITMVCPYSEELENVQDFAEKQIISSLTQVLDRRKELDHFSRQKTFLDCFGKSIETGLEKFSNKFCSFVRNELKSEFSVLLILDQASGELFNKYEPDMEEKRIEVVGSIFEEPVVQSRSVLNLSDISQNTKQRHDLVRITGHYVQSLLCMPIVSLHSNDVIGIVCVFNKKQPATRFTKADESNLKFCCSNTAGLLENALEWEREMVVKRQQEHLLKVAKNLFTHADDVSVLLNEIMTEARSLTNAERCSLFLLDHERNELVAKVFDGEIPGNGKHKEGWDLTIPINQGIVGHVAVTGKLLNIKDTYNHPLFYRGLDEKTGFRTKNVLCFPIKDEEEVIGVAELCNKVNGACFTKFDEDLTKAFAIYCGISIFQSMLYKKASSAWQRSQVTSELMIYHMNVPQNEVDGLLKPIQEIGEFSGDFAHFPYMPRTLDADKTVPAVLFMMDDLGLINRWKLPKEILIRFTLMVKRGYRDPPYHNWYHAFTVAHFCYLLYKNTDMESRLLDIERLALFVACLCHDLDHRGTNNAFQVSSNSTLAALYSSEGSVMERHHFAQTVCILNSPGCNIFKNLSENDFKKVLDLIRTIILATDLAHHLKILKDIRRMAVDGYKADRPDHHNLLVCLMMTASDLSDQTKPWGGTRKIADLIYTEFFSQGDLEKVMGHTPMEMMDRERACIPKLQIDFLESIALPVYSALNDVLPETKIVYDTVLSNRDHWKVIQKENDQTTS